MTSTSGRWTDQEIKSLDGDRLKFGTYSRVLAQVILEADTPLTIGVFGPWGCGKTSLLRLVEESLQKASTAPRRRVWTVWFNAWRYDREEALWRALILRVLTVLRENLLGARNVDKPLEGLPKSKKKVAQELDDLQASLYREVEREEIGGVTMDWEKMATGAAGWVTRLSLGLIPGLGGPLSEMVGQAQKELSGKNLDTLFSAVQRQRRKVHRDHVRSLEQFRGNLEKIVKTHIEEPNRRLVVFIDDLDRCLPEKAIEVLEAIKLFLDVPGCVFLIGADRDVIEEGIRVKYDSFLSGLGGDVSPQELAKHMPITGDDYLEKIVQLPFHIPPLREELVQHFIQEQEADLPEGCAGIFCQGLERNPRKVKRTLNIFRLLRLLAAERAKADEMQPVEPQLLAKMVIILIRWRELFQDLQEYPNLLQELEKMWVEGGPTAPRLGSPGPPESTADEAKDAPGAEAVPSTLPLLNKYGPVRALGRMLKLGPPWFADLSLEQLNEYIYLARSTTEAAKLAEVDVDQRRWADLLSNDLTKIRAALAELEEGEKASHREQLLTVMRSNRPPVERVSAGNALALLGDPRPGVDPELTGMGQIEFCYVPRGPFWMGSGHEDEMAYDHEKPLHQVDIPYAYWMARYPVTNAQFRLFAEDPEGYQADTWWTKAGLEWRKGEGGPQDYGEPWNLANHPVVTVTWYEAVAFAAWLERVLGESGLLPEGQVVRLPSEAEWEKAARGGLEIPATSMVLTLHDAAGQAADWEIVENPSLQRRYPWGQEPDAERANWGDTGIGSTSAVGCFGRGRSPYGVEELSGNAWEWCATKWERSYGGYRGDNGPEGEEARVVRGGTFHINQRFVRCASRARGDPELRYDGVGFRVVVFPGSPA